jgi:hypothetical protein|tara:strand:+ start:200 stop:433 length:234 start_codon:yes stop_codon:yes gene_type:complete
MFNEEKKMSDKKRLRQEEAIKRLTQTVASHEANTELTISIMEDHNLSTNTAEKVEKIRQRKLQYAKDTIENTKKRMV